MEWSSAKPHSSLGPSLFILGRFLFLGVGLGFDMKRAELVKSFGPTTSIYYHMVEFNYGQERVSFILDFPIQTNESLIENDTPSKILFARFAQYIKFL